MCLSVFRFVPVHLALLPPCWLGAAAGAGQLVGPHTRKIQSGQQQLFLQETDDERLVSIRSAVQMNSQVLCDNDQNISECIV